MVKISVRSREKGQILVVLVLALIGLLAFTALAIDVGMTFSDRRYDQNVADAAALSAAELVTQAMKAQYPGESGISIVNFHCGSADSWSGPDSWPTAPDFLQYGRPISWVHVTNAAVGRAYTNNVVIDKDLSDGNGVSLHCVDKVIPGDPIGVKYIEVKVMVSSVTQTSFAHFVFGGSLRNTVTAIVKIKPKEPLSLGNSILALNTNCQGNTGGMEFDGGVIVNSFDGGKIFSNQCMETHAGAATVNVFSGSDYDTSDCAINTGAIGYLDDHILPINATTCPALTHYTKPIERMHSPTPDCSVYKTTQSGKNIDNGKTGGSARISPGLWDNITVTTSDFNLTLEPGLYCLTGGFKFTGGTLKSLNSSLSPKTPCDPNATGGCGVTLYILDGDVEIMGNGAMQLSAPMSDSNAVNGALPFLLIGAPDDYYGQVDIEGTADDAFVGTIIVPFADLIIGGNSTATTPSSPSSGPTFTSLIADRIKFHGDTAVNVRYDMDKELMGSAKLEMEK